VLAVGVANDGKEQFCVLIREPLSLCIIESMRPSVFAELVKGRMISSQTVVVDAQDNPDLDLSIQQAINGYLRARDQLQRDMDAVDAYDHATNVLYEAFIQGFGVTDRRILCIAFQAFRRELIRQHDANQAAIRITDFQ
jgi:hypothetical protein